ncbi:putative ribonuclease H-like domain-containing protein [Tanacetum coccineum]
MPWLLKMELEGMTGATQLRKNILQTFGMMAHSSSGSSSVSDSEENNKSKSDKGYNAVPPPFTGNFIPFKLDLTFMDEIVESENMDAITIVTPSNVDPKTVSKNNFRPPVIEDWNSDDESEGNPQQKEYKEKGVINSGCSRHMTGNKCYLSEYEDYDGGFVSFGDGKGRISGKGKIKTGTLDFNNVLLRVPRKDNIYSVDLKSVVPTRGLTCLFAKATIDESNLWHRRLGHIKFKNMNKLVRGNLVRGFPSKIFENDHSCVACQKGKKHKASFVTDDFSRFSWVFFLATKDETSGILKTFITEIENQLEHKVKGIKREFSVARTPQQNSVAERRNRTLIEAARTMLVDSKLPTTFLAEAVNTACYVLNRVLVIKPHNKTPYELIRRRTLLIDFMKPFGYAVTILNTRDHLGKFDGKADEGFFVGTYVSAARPSFTNDDPSSPVNAAEASNAFEEHLFERFSPFKNAFTLLLVSNVTPMDDTKIFGNAYDDEDVGTEADLNNLETTMNVSPIPTTRFDKDHPKDQIIGDFNSTIQTRRMTKISYEHAMVYYINKQRRTNHKDYQNYLFTCFLSQMEPKKVIQALEDPSWIEAMQEELLQFQLQKV